VCLGVGPDVAHSTSPTENAMLAERGVQAVLQFSGPELTAMDDSPVTVGNARRNLIVNRNNLIQNDSKTE
jgi:hypothetical protein